MEILESKTQRFLSINLNHCAGYGYGNGYCSGNGNNNGYCSGSGYVQGDGAGNGCGYGNGYSNRTCYCDGDGYGYGGGYDDGNGDDCGNGYGYGNGDGDGYGIKEINGDKVHMIDGVATIITYVAGDLAQGFILEHNIYLKPCYVAKYDTFFGHGKTAKDAMHAAMGKSIIHKPTNERIELFLSKYNKNSRIPAKELFDWHGIITGSCKLGRENFCSNHDINMDTDQFTMDEFIALTINSYGGETIKRLKEKWERIHNDNQ